MFVIFCCNVKKNLKNSPKECYFGSHDGRAHFQAKVIFEMF